MCTLVDSCLWLFVCGCVVLCLQILLLPFSPQTAADLWLVAHELSLLSAWLSALQQHQDLAHADVARRNDARRAHASEIQSIAGEIRTVATGTRDGCVDVS
jgi:hypothetical protein